VEALTTHEPVTAALGTSDYDQDGVIDSEDQCPSEPEDLDGFADKDGCPEEDADLDGRPDTDDLCPEQMETINGFEDLDGCPDKGRALCNDCRAIKRLVLVVYFEEGSDQANEDELSGLESLAKEIQDADPPVDVFIVGHSSDWGEVIDQKDLSRRRANLIRDKLESFQVDTKKISISSKGAKSPRVPHGSKGASYLNDRVEILVQ